MERHFTLSCNEIHLWQADLSSTEPSILPLLRALSADEYARAERYALPHLRRRFVVARGILRSLVGSYLGIVPSEVRFCYGAFGKPMLDEARHKEALAFNLSHTEDFALFAFSLVHDIGVDVERIQKSFEVLSLAQQHFSINEYAALSALPTELQLSAFYACWTRKEAYLKAKGSGIANHLSKFDVTVSPKESAQLLRIEGEAEEARGWKLLDIPVPPEYHATVAVANRDCQLKCFSWQHDFVNLTPHLKSGI